MIRTPYSVSHAKTPIRQKDAPKRSKTEPRDHFLFFATTSRLINWQIWIESGLACQDNQNDAS